MTLKAAAEHLLDVVGRGHSTKEYHDAIAGLAAAVDEKPAPPEPKAEPEAKPKAKPEAKPKKASTKKRK